MKKTKFTEAQPGGRSHRFCAPPGGHRNGSRRSMPEDGYQFHCGSEATYYNWQKKYGGLGVHYQVVPERIQAAAARWTMAVNLSAAADRSKAMDKWAYENQVILDFSRPDKPTARRPLLIRSLNPSMAAFERTPRG